MQGKWLPITEYSAKHRVSVSTLRRRIKTDDIKYRFFEGKYLLLDESVEATSPHRPSLSESLVNGFIQKQSEIPTIKKMASPSEETLDGPILSAASKLLTELKKAYSQILQDKEEHILQLREEVTDLKTLVRVLEGENDKLNSYLPPHSRREINA